MDKPVYACRRHCRCYDDDSRRYGDLLSGGRRRSHTHTHTHTHTASVSVRLFDGSFSSATKTYKERTSEFYENELPPSTCCWLLLAPVPVRISRADTKLHSVQENE